MNLYVLLALANILMAILATAWLGFRDAIWVRKLSGTGNAAGRDRKLAVEPHREAGAKGPDAGAGGSAPLNGADPG